MRHFTGGILLALFVTACKTAAPVVQQTPPEPVILTLGNKAFTTDDFFQSFTKNQLSADSAQRTDVKNYFDLYTNLKLKVLAAESEGRDTTEAFREEMNTYRKQLAQSYLTDKVLVESLAAEAYQRMQEDVNASHIFIPVSEYAQPSDTLVAYQTIMSLRKQALEGTDFTKLARENSKDVKTAQNGGSLGYIAAFENVYPLETAAYTTPVNGISMPVRTRFGYHILKVNNRRPSRGRVRVAHILVRMSPAADEAGQKAAQERINKVYAQLQRGESFEQVCRLVSDDATSKANGGVLPPFEPGRWVPAFEDAAFALSKPGDYSKPVKTNYGWHIIKLIERKGLESFTTLAPSLRQRVTTDSRADMLRQVTVQRLQKEYPVQTDQPLLAIAIAKADSNLLRGQWRYTEPLEAPLQNKPLVTIGKQPYTVNQFFAYVRQRQQPQRNPALTLASGSPAMEKTLGGSSAIAMQRLFDRFIGDQLIATEEMNLDKKSPEFRALLTEIRDGVLLSQVMEQNVWERSMVDSTGQRQYFEQHKDKYRFPERARATLVVAQNDSLLKQAVSMLSSRPPYQLRRSAAPVTFTKNQTALSETLRESLFDVLVVMNTNPDYVVEVSGSHDATEADSVSAGRIRSVVGYLQKNGIPLSRIMEKDFQGVRPGAVKEAQRNVSFQYFSNAKDDIARVLNSKYSATTNPARSEGLARPSETSPVTILTGLFARGENSLLDGISQWKPGTTTLHRDNKAISVLIERIEPARAKTFDEARGAVINEYQATLEKQWLAQLRQTYPVKVNEDQLRKLVK
ncbi:peptidylprolyl isomerase [Spirosoma linguale]|uniref:PpiC-type peptidyl-prolyl cis-trans isomerase n=1 Tax=Spirosoma linguale (strain ATCC 33905 / DSM 74 / LMG 10896 / Claus 1) TaxID=504472 RepID=D2QHY2_SPILD|nr:PpiC-type peptidyl-prolyl cis-trans isomerase [Spirosoma linguale DSM 74]